MGRGQRDLVSVRLSVETLGRASSEFRRFDVDALVLRVAVEGDDLQQFEGFVADALETILRAARCAASRFPHERKLAQHHIVRPVVARAAFEDHPEPIRKQLAVLRQCQFKEIEIEIDERTQMGVRAPIRTIAICNHDPNVSGIPRSRLPSDTNDTPLAMRTPLLRNHPAIM